MKIAITGHTAGIRKALAEALHENEIIGLSTMMTQSPMSAVPGLDMDHYFNQIT